MKSNLTIFLLFFFVYCNSQQFHGCNVVNSTFSTGDVDWYNKADGDIEAGTATANCHRGWAVYDISPIPDNADITDADVNFYVSSESTSSYHTLFLAIMTINPVVSSRTTIWDDIGSANGFYWESLL
ncbi:MAG: hypothetical protein HN704_16015 [Bacteroidetes bacterium]|jgi:hypothetical protein|nr:hypothetical protein [Bacteroidota bacterium]